jgi:omega-amidase
VFDTPYGRCGVGICYDVRFPLLSMLLRQEGCSMLFFPGAFNTTTGPAHWELLLRARALDTQSFVAAISPARNPDSDYKAWGHSTVVNPWGEVIATTEEQPATVYSELPLTRVDEVRRAIPVSKQARTDLYELGWKK